MDLGASVTCFKATLNGVENIPWNTEDLFLTKVTRPIYKNKTKQTQIFFFFFKGSKAVLLLTIVPAASDPGRRLSR